MHITYNKQPYDALACSSDCTVMVCSKRAHTAKKAYAKKVPTPGIDHQHISDVSSRVLFTRHIKRQASSWRRLATNHFTSRNNHPFSTTNKTCLLNLKLPTPSLRSQTRSRARNRRSTFPYSSLTSNRSAPSTIQVARAKADCNILWRKVEEYRASMKAQKDSE